MVAELVAPSEGKVARPLELWRGLIPGLRNRLWWTHSRTAACLPSSS
jgi:hypothetical protein